MITNPSLHNIPPCDMITLMGWVSSGFLRILNVFILCIYLAVPNLVVACLIFDIPYLR